MFQVTNRILVKPAHREAFEARFEARKGNLEHEPGFVRNLVLRPLDEEGAYLVQTLWETEAHFEAWVGSPSFRAAHADPPPRDWFAGPSKLEKHEIAVATET